MLISWVQYILRQYSWHCRGYKHNIESGKHQTRAIHSQSEVCAETWTHCNAWYIWVLNTEIYCKYEKYERKSDKSSKIQSIKRVIKSVEEWSNRWRIVWWRLWQNVWTIFFSRWHKLKFMNCWIQFCAQLGSCNVFLAPQSGALRISAYRDFHPIHTTYSFRAFKPFYGDQKQCK